MKSNNTNSISDIIFVIIFLILLFIPMLKIDNSEASPEENKFLSKWKPLINEDVKINLKFGTDFNNWYSDRFNQRKKLIYFYNLINYYFFSKNDQGYYDKKKLACIFNFEFFHYDLQTFKDLINYLIDFNKILKNKNIKLYIIITPQRVDIEPININPYNKDFFCKHEINYINYLNKNNILNIIYPVNELKQEAKNNITFYKTSFHWTDDAAFVAYQELMKMIKKDFPNIKSLNRNDFNYFYDNRIRVDYNEIKKFGDNFLRFGVPPKELSKYGKFTYKYYRHKNIKELKDKSIDEKFRKINYFYYPKGQNLRVILIGPSTSEAFSHFIPFTFKNVKKIRTNLVQGIEDSNTYKFFKYYNNEIFDYKPDIIIFCLPYFSLYQISTLFETE